MSDLTAFRIYSVGCLWRATVRFAGLPFSSSTMSKISPTTENALEVFPQANRKSKKQFKGERNAPELPNQWRRNFADKLILGQFILFSSLSRKARDC